MQAKYQIFISYRRDGGEDLARLLRDRLTNYGFKVFFDVESLRSGAFNKALFEKIAECTDVLVVLPPNGLDRCSNPDDWVRLEIAHALKLKKNVIPILMRNFSFPKTLPEDIRDLATMNGINSNNEYFDASIEKLINQRIKSKPLNRALSDDRLLEEAESGDVQAMNELGLRYELGSESLLVNQRKAMEFFIRASDKGDPAAMYNLGDIYEQCGNDLTLVYDYGIEKSIFNLSADEARVKMRSTAADYYIQAERKQFLPAVYRLANLAEEDHDYTTALERYRFAADLGYPPAQNALGYYLMNGIMTKSDPQAAVSLYKQAAEAGYPPAVYNYARVMELRNIEQAIVIYKKVAFGENAIPQAALSLARLYERSLHDLRSAITYYRIAVDSGIPEAESDLRRCQNSLFGN